MIPRRIQQVLAGTASGLPDTWVHVHDTPPWARRGEDVAISFTAGALQTTLYVGDDEAEQIAAALTKQVALNREGVE